MIWKNLHPVIVSVICATLLSGCLSCPFDRESYAAETNTDLLAGIALKLLAPTNESIYAREAGSLAGDGIDWQDIAHFSTACQIHAMKVNASRLDLEIVHFLWVENAENTGAAAISVKNTLGEESYRSAVDAYGGAAFDCGLEARRQIEILKSR